MDFERKAQVQLPEKEGMDAGHIEWADIYYCDIYFHICGSLLLLIFLLSSSPVQVLVFTQG